MWCTRQQRSASGGPQAPPPLSDEADQLCACCLPGNQRLMTDPLHCTETSNERCATQWQGQQRSHQPVLHEQASNACAMASSSSAPELALHKLYSQAELTVPHARAAQGTCPSRGTCRRAARGARALCAACAAVHKAQIKAAIAAGRLRPFGPQRLSPACAAFVSAMLAARPQAAPQRAPAAPGAHRPPLTGPRPDAGVDTGRYCPCAI